MEITYFVTRIYHTILIDGHIYYRNEVRNFNRETKEWDRSELNWWSPDVEVADADVIQLEREFNISSCLKDLI